MGHIVRYDKSRHRDRGLRIEALDKSIGRRHNARFFIRKIYLSRRFDGQLWQPRPTASNFVPCLLLLLFALREVRGVLDSDFLMARSFTFLDRRPRFVDLGDQYFAPSDLCGDVELRIPLVFHNLGELEELRDLTFELCFDFAGVGVAQSMVFRGVRFYFRAVEAHLAELEKPQFVRHREDVQEDLREFGKHAFAKISDRIVIGARVRRNVAEGD